MAGDLLVRGLSEHERESIRRLAERRGSSQNDVVRELIAEGLRAAALSADDIEDELDGLGFLAEMSEPDVEERAWS